ncbi:Protein of unknown function [Microbulbifer donghaiensis]|uniref:DUF2884 family protein n=1 Tax=Microbulbifer donghaiensis TaxID=494016 RepID=A0A1M5FF72_9GAMM|nr:DUF2884 family protein [Microbulbifer donghaiensis]SHF90217.1 Protein of unknown function [Microbulbifer donghaiensis]
MWKPLAISTLIATSAAAHAGDIHLNISDEEQCNAELNYSVRVGPDFFEARKDKGDAAVMVRYQSPTELVVDGETVQLNEQQQQLVRDYQQRLHGTGREILLISLEAVDIALNGMSAAITVLAGKDHPDNIELKQTSDEILRRAEERLNREGEIYTLGDPDIDAFIEQAVEEEFEPKIEKLAMESAGTIAWHALKAVFTGGRSIEHEAEQMAEEIEQEVEQRAEGLEMRAAGLCQQLEAIDRIESELQQTIPALAPYDFVAIR